MLPDDLHLEIFGFCVHKYQSTKLEIEAWQSLVHVCRRWRSVVFGSPRRLKLRLVCTDKTPVREALDVWPPLPLVIRSSLTVRVDNVVAALERRDRVGAIDLFNVNSLPLESVLETMQEPFPELTFLALSSYGGTLPVLPDSFLRGSAPRLRVLILAGIPFPGVPKLLLSATHLLFLHLLSIPHSGYISPEAMATALSTLTSLQSLILQFQSPRSLPDLESRRRLSSPRSVLPLLRHFFFKGNCEYLDDLVARIDAPRLHDLSITLFNDTVFDIPQFIQFITCPPTLKSLETAHVVFDEFAARVNFLSQPSGNGSLQMEIFCNEMDRQALFLRQVCSSFLPPLSTSENLYIYRHRFSHPHRQDNIENTLWLGILHPFTAVKNLYLCKEFAPRIVSALEELVEGRTTEVLPTLQNVFLEELRPSGPDHEGIGKLVAARELSGHPITVSHWERDPEKG
jgi:F-box-like